MTELLYSLLHSTGGMRDIYKAMDSDDLADVVRGTTEALIKTLSIPMHVQEDKSTNLSNNLRRQGNVHYEYRNYEAAILWYNKALAYAPRNSKEVKLAYANISAVMFTIKAYQACLQNINACFALGCPPNLEQKLKDRMEETMKLIDHENIPDNAPENHLEFKVTRNAEVPCASKDIDILHTHGFKKVVAAREIKSGTIVAMERAFVSTQTDSNKYKSCYYCHKIALFFTPCEGCCKALFCSEDCKNRCMDDYHCIECQIVAFMGTMYVHPVDKLVVRTAIKMSLKLGWKEIRAASHDIGEKRLKNSSVKSAFDVNDPVSILSYDDQNAVIQGKIFNGSFTCAAAVHCLSRVPNYFPEAGNARKEAIDAISRIMLHLYATFTNRIVIDCSAYDYYTNTNKTGIQRNVGWFSFTSKLTHSCEPNLFVLGLNDQVALVAIHPIKKGEELTITYVDHFYDTRICRDYRSEKFSNIRQHMIISAIQFLCECRVCMQRWDTNTHSQTPMTQRQNQAYVDLVITAKAEKRNYRDILKVSADALDAFAGLANSTQQRSAYKVHRFSLFECQTAKTQNKTYTKLCVNS